MFSLIFKLQHPWFPWFSNRNIHWVPLFSSNSIHVFIDFQKRFISADGGPVDLKCSQTDQWYRNRMNTIYPISSCCQQGLYNTLLIQFFIEGAAVRYIFSLEYNCCTRSDASAWSNDVLAYHIFVIFFTRAKFLENKIYTEKRQFFVLNL